MEPALYGHFLSSKPLKQISSTDAQQQSSFHVVQGLTSLSVTLLWLYQYNWRFRHFGLVIAEGFLLCSRSWHICEMFSVLRLLLAYTLVHRCVLDKTICRIKRNWRYSYLHLRPFKNVFTWSFSFCEKTSFGWISALTIETLKDGG